MINKKRHHCTLCRKKRSEKFLKPVRDSDRLGSQTWICIDNCSDGRINKKVQSYMQERQSSIDKGQYNLKNGLSSRSTRLSKEDLKLSFLDPKESIVPGNKFILDICCGNKMFWFNKNNESTLYHDIKSDLAMVKPMDFRNIKYMDNSFNLVVFDPPHIFKKSGKYSWINKRYGTLNKDTWISDIVSGFNECMRVLKNKGVLIFKWSEGSISVSTILSIIPEKPLFGHTSDKKNKTHWLCYMKLN